MLILASALRLFENARYGDATMAQVAKHAGIAKGTLYLYFPTKETLFLELLGDRLGSWFEDLERELAAAAVVRGGPVDVPEILAHSLAKRVAMCRLWSLLHSTLECNVDHELVQEFTLRFAGQLDRGVSVLEPHLPSLDRAQIHALLLRTQALTVGLVQMANPSPFVQACYGDPRLAPLKVDFERELRQALRDWIEGWEHAGAAALN